MQKEEKYLLAHARPSLFLFDPIFITWHDALLTFTPYLRAQIFPQFGHIFVTSLSPETERFLCYNGKNFTFILNDMNSAAYVGTGWLLNI